MPCTFGTYAYLAVSWWHRVMPTNGVYLLLFQCFITLKFENLYSRLLFKENVRHPVRTRFSLLGTRIGSLKHLKNHDVQYFKAIIIVALSTRYTASGRHCWAIIWKTLTAEGNNNVCINC